MLVLSRKKHEIIVINDEITVTVCEIMGDKVRLGIVAPKEIPVHRKEVNDAIKKNGSRRNSHASHAATDSQSMSPRNGGDVSSFSTSRSPTCGNQQASRTTYANRA